MQTKRFLSPVLQKFLDDALSSRTFQDPKNLLIQAALACEGVMEEGGDNRGRMVEAFQATIGGAVKESWCLSFIQAVVAYVEDRMGVRCSLPLTEHVATLWDKTPKTLRHQAPEKAKPGDLILWVYMGERDGKRVRTSLGHVGLIIETNYGQFRTVEGNTTPTGAVEREGNGVAVKLPGWRGSYNRPIQGFVQLTFTPLLSSV